MVDVNVASHDGAMDAVRAEESANGITNTAEFGSARKASEFAALLPAGKKRNRDRRNDAEHGEHH